MRNATLRQLKVFEAVAHHLSFSRAAQTLHLTQPAVSIQVKKLEENAGLALFEQLGKKIYLTPAGTEMLRSVRAIIALFQETDQALAHFKGIQGGKLSVGVISAGDYFFPRLLVDFMGRHAGTQLDFAVYNREELLRRLRDNLTDLAVMVRPPQDADTTQQSFAPHPYVILAAPEHPLVGKKRIPLARLASELFVIREKGSDTRHAMQAFFGDGFDRLNISMEIRSTETIKQAVMAGMGLSFLSAHTLSRELQAQSLAVLDVQGFPMMLNWYVVHRQTKRLPPVAQAFKDFLLQEGAARMDSILGGNAPPGRQTPIQTTTRAKKINRA